MGPFAPKTALGVPCLDRCVSTQVYHCNLADGSLGFVWRCAGTLGHRHWESVAIECHWYPIHLFSPVENGCQDEEGTE